LYPTDLSNEQWNLLQSVLPARKTTQRRGRPPADLRRICNALLYFVRAGCAWRLLPRDFGRWKTVYHYFWLWSKQGYWQVIHDVLRASGGCAVCGPTRVTAEKPSPGGWPRNAKQARWAWKLCRVAKTSEALRPCPNVGLLSGRLAGL